MQTPPTVDEHRDTIHVLHVDDEADQLALTKRFLEDADPAIHVEPVRSPQEARRMLRRRPFDCVVSDYVMPELDGVSLARRVREESQIPFILYTGRGSEEVAREAFAAGVDDYLKKEIDPSNYQVLAKRIRTAVEKHRTEKARVRASKLFEAKMFSLHTHAAELSRAEDMEEIAASTFNAIEQVLGFNLANFSVVEGDILHEIFTWGIETDEIFEQPLDGPGITVRVVRTGETQLVPDTRLDKDYVLGYAEGVYEPLSELAVPVKIDDEVVAVINIESTKLNAFNDEDRRLMEIFAEHIASAIRRIGFIQSEHIYQAKLAALHSNALKLAEAGNIDEVCSIALKTIEIVLGFYWAGIGLVEGDAIRYSAYKGFRIPEDWILPLDGPGITVRSIRTGDTQLVPDIRLDEDYVLGPAEGVYEPLSELAVPVKSHDGAVGVINVESIKLNAFTVEDQKLLEILAEHVASALSRLGNVEMLRASEERYQTLLEASLDAVCVIADEKYAYMNRRHAEILGYADPLDLIGREAIEFVAPEDKERVMAMIRGRPKGEVHPNQYELKLQRKDGTKIDVETHVSVIEYEGKPASLAFTRDISERKKAEGALRRSEEQARSLLEFQNKVIDTAIVWIDLLDDEGNVILWNRAAELISGYFREEVVGHKKIWEWLYPEPYYRAKIFEQAKNVIEGERVENVETTIRCKDGMLKTILWYDNNILDDKGKPMGSIAVGIDITEQRRMEKELREHTEGLEKMVDEKTRELLDAERIAAAGRVAAMVGHDLRGPLNTISNAMYILKKKPEMADKMVEMIEGAVQRSSQMLEELRHKTRDSPLNIETVDLEALVRTAVEEAQIPESVDVSLRLEDGLEAIPLDQMKVRRVMDNLISNALDAMSEGGTLTVEAERVGNNIIINVSDTGVGIPEEEIPKLFNTFHTTKPMGMGLGLTYCKRALETHCGAITVESKAGEGTTFTITLPAKSSMSRLRPNLEVDSRDR